MTKQIIIQGQTFNLYSLDGKSWCSDPSLFPRIAKRKQKIEAKNALKPWEMVMIVNLQGGEAYDL